MTSAAASEEIVSAQLKAVRRALERREKVSADADRELGDAVRHALVGNCSVKAVADTLGWTRASVYNLLKRTAAS
jgi:hypothetical protein